jgi:hypothetical protein
MIVITRNGKTTVITGWRAWLMGVAIFLAATAFLFVIAFVMLGVAITAGAVLLIVVPAVVGVAILASLFRRQRMTGRRQALPILIRRISDGWRGPMAPSWYRRTRRRDQYRRLGFLRGSACRLGYRELS